MFLTKTFVPLRMQGRWNRGAWRGPILDCSHTVFIRW